MRKLSIFAVMVAILMGCNESEEFKYIPNGENQNGNTVAGSNVFSVHKLGLTKANTCEDYRSHLLDVAAAEIAQEHFSMHWVYADDMAVPNMAESDNAGASASKDDSAGEFTTTNLQEENVDEADIVKNDGEWMYILQGQNVSILKAWPADQMKKVAKLNINGYGLGMFLNNGRLIVLSQDYSSWNDNVSREAVLVNIFNVEDPDNLSKIRSYRIEGNYVSSRMVDGRLFVVTENWMSAYDWRDVNKIPGLPEYDWKKLEKLTEDERQHLIEQYTPVIRSYLEKKSPTIESLRFPKVSDGNITKNAVECDNLYIPNTSSREEGMLIVAEISGDSFENYTSSAVADGGWTVYASTENIYLVSTSSNWYWHCWDDEDTNNLCRNYSQIHRFSFKNNLKYVASGEVEGYVTDPYWMSEYDGHLRVASHRMSGWSNTEGAALSVLDINTMNQVGRVTGIAPNEQIYAARMFGKKGYLVTFRNTDPLFSIDLSDPKKPEIKGQLEINGYSSYIHPLGEDALLTIGRDGDESGNIKGVQLQIFDVSDMSNPKLAHKQVITKESDNSYSDSAALWDTHAFTYHAGSGLLAIPINMYHWSWYNNSNFSGVVVYKATREDGFKLVGLVNHADLVPQQDGNNHYYHWWTQLDRSRFMFKTAGVYDKDAYLYTISDVGVKVNNALKPSETIKSVKLDYSYPAYYNY